MDYNFFVKLNNKLKGMKWKYVHIILVLLNTALHTSNTPCALNKKVLKNHINNNNNKNITQKLEPTKKK